MEPIFDPLVQELESRLEKLGLYLMNVEVTVVPIDRDLIEDQENYSPDILGDPNLAIYLTSIFTISDIAWKDRILDPATHAENQQFKLVAPTEFEVDLESFKNDILNWDEDED